MANGHVSFSEWGSWNECQWRWFRDYREGRRAPIYSVHLTFGTCIHSALEKIKPPAGSLKEGEGPNVEQIIADFEVSFRKRYKKVRPKDPKALNDEEIDVLVESGKRILRSIDECDEIREAEVLFTEYPLIIKMDRTDDVEIKFKGFIDVVIRTKDKRGRSILYICDYKTCSWGWNREKKTDPNLLAQLRLYKHFFSKKFKLDPKNVRTAFVLLKKTPSKKDSVVEFLPISAGPTTTMRAVNRLSEAVTGMESNDYRKNRNACINQWGDRCSYLDTPLCVD